MVRDTSARPAPATTSQVRPVISQKLLRDALLIHSAANQSQLARIRIEIKPAARFSRNGRGMADMANRPFRCSARANGALAGGFPLRWLRVRAPSRSAGPLRRAVRLSRTEADLARRNPAPRLNRAYARLSKPGVYTTT